MCAKRDTGYNYVTMEKPEKFTKSGDKSTDWKCNGEMSKMCGNVNGKEGEVYCIPPTSKCPITKIEFDSNGKLVTSFNPAVGQPLVNV